VSRRGKFVLWVLLLFAAGLAVPTATGARLADTATPEPELEPHGLRSST